MILNAFFATYGTQPLLSLVLQLGVWGYAQPPAKLRYSQPSQPPKKSGASVTDFVTKLSLNLFFAKSFCATMLPHREIRNFDGMRLMDCKSLPIFSNKTERQWRNSTFGETHWTNRGTGNHDSTSGVIKLSSCKQNLKLQRSNMVIPCDSFISDTHHGINKDL